MAREENNDTHQTIPTPNPQERSLVVTVEESVFTNNPDIIPAPETLYQDCDRSLFGGDYRREFLNYVYVQQLANRGTRAVLVFAKGKTEEEAKVPFRETTEKRNHPWPPILYALVLIPDYTFLRTGKGYNAEDEEISEVVAPNHYVREVFVPGVNEGTKMVKREFFGPRPFDIPQTPVPVPTSVSYDVNGVQGRFPECLHPRIEIASTRSGIAQVVAGVVSEVGGALEGQIFPATNYEEWAPYITTDTQELTEAGWYRVQMIAIPPDPPDVIVQ